MVELQDLLEKQNYELAQMKERMSSLSSRVSEVEQELETARKDLIKSEEMNSKYQRDIKEVTAHVHSNTRARARRIKASWKQPLLWYTFPDPSTPEEQGKTALSRNRAGFPVFPFMSVFWNGKRLPIQEMGRSQRRACCSSANAPFGLL